MAMDNTYKIFNAVKAQATFTPQEDLRRYLTGFASSFGYVVTDRHSSVFYTDPRYVEGAKEALKDTAIEVKLFNGTLESVLKQYKEIAVPLSGMLYPDYLRLAALNIKIVDSSQAFTKAMAVKESEELACIKKACEIADSAYLALLPRIKEGMSENEVAAELEYLMRRFGASGTSFETIVAFGENSSVPHHETGDRKLRFGDIILIDFGCRYNGYCSDCTRTFLFGDDGKHGEFKEIYGHVLKAHMLAKEQITSGITGREADGYARDHLRAFGLDKYFTHSLGHGIGINIHEFPVLSYRSLDVLKDNMVFSDEPGVYFEGKFGIRIEDTVTLDNGNVVSLTDSDKNLTVI